MQLLTESLVRGLKPNKLLSNGLTPLVTACQNAFADVLPILCERGALPDKIVADTTALLEAVGNNSVDCVRALLDCGASPGTGNKTQFTPLMLAARNGHEECIRLLLEHGAEVNSADKYQWTALHEAAFAGHLSCVVRLLDHGADPLKGTRGCYGNNHRHSAPGFSALHYAAYMGHAPVVKTLLKSTPPDIIAIDKRTPLIAATKGNVETVLMLLNAGANIEAKSRYGVTALFSAVGKGRLDIMRVILEAGADPNTDYMDIGTPISMAATDVPTLPNRDKRAMIKLLLEYGADINKPCRKTGYTVLYGAVCSKDLEFVKYVLDNGARDVSKFYDKSYAIDFAENNGMPELMDLIKKY